MGFCYEFVNALITVFSVTFDLGSDIINSLDFIGLNATQSILQSAKICVRGLDFTCNSTAENTHHYRESWGYIGLFLVFLPGILLLPPCLCGAIRNSNWKYLFLFIFMIPVYPITLIIVQLFSLFSACSWIDKGVQRVAMLALGMEAFIECFSQLSLQGFTILYGYNITTTQVVSVTFSFLSLARTTIMFDITMKRVSRDSMNKCNKVAVNFVATSIFSEYIYNNEHRHYKLCKRKKFDL